MKGLVFERNGEPSDVLSWRALPDPKVGANEVLVRMRRRGVVLSRRSPVGAFD